MIACGANNIIIQNEKNEIYACGQLGLGDHQYRNKFEKVEYDFGGVKNIACGMYHIIIQNKKNEIYVCGGNSYGQLGLGDYENRDKFEKVEHNFGEIKNIACGRYHTIIQNEKNEIYVCGYNRYGQLGLGNKCVNTFKKVDFVFGEIKNIACGENYTVIQNKISEIYVCGYNYCGQLGLGDNKQREKFEKVKENFGEIIKITCGDYYTVIYNKKNEIYMCGYSGHSGVGLGDDKSRTKFRKLKHDFGKIKNIVCGYYHMIIQNEKNEIYMCGYNEYGQLGLGDNSDRSEFEKVEYDFGEIKNIACGYYHTVIQNEKNEIYVCGRNSEGQLGFCDNMNRNIFEKVEIDDIFKKIFNFMLKLNIEKIAL